VLIKKSAEFPVHQCMVNSGWQKDGAANVFIIRQMPNSKFIFAVYLIDLFCLGLKDVTFSANLSHAKIQTILGHSPMPLSPIDYEDARSIILGSIEYAHQHGFEPCKDWKNTKYLVESEKPFINKFEFGLNGRAIYMQSLQYDPVEVISKLRKN
jgi:hypothetical protein